YTVTIANTGTADAVNVGVRDDISRLLDHGSLTAASAGGTLSGGILRWNNLSIDAGTATALAFAVRLDVAGWAVGTTNLPNAVVVPAGDCATGSTKPACRTTTSVTPRFALSLAKSVATT